MIGGLLLGLFRARWWWLIPLTIAGIALEAWRADRADALRLEAGIAPYETGLGAIIVGTALFTVGAYLVGRLLRLAFDRLMR